MSAVSSPPPRRRAAAWLALAALVLAVASAAALLLGPRAGLGSGGAFHGTAYPEPEPAPGFELTDHRGEVARLEDFRGRTVLLFFGFTHCPDVCPLTLARLSQALEALGARAADARVLLVSVDPERDTPEVLARYVERFGRQVTGLTGAAEALAELRRAYGVYAAPQAGHDGHPMLVHTTAVFGIDRQGRLRVLLRAEGPEEELRADIARLLRL